MNYASTRGKAPQCSLSEAVTAGLASDGGLFMPTSLPRLTPEQFADWSDLPAVGERILQGFFEGDSLAASLTGICRHAFSIEVPLRSLKGEGDYCLELFHGPTAAFKDFAAGFLAATLSALRDERDPLLNILVATSGDTGAAIASAFEHRPGFRVFVLYPETGVSARQAHGLECWGDNVHTLRVSGSFDDCQRMVKEILGKGASASGMRVSSANSINIGRLLPQTVYYADAVLKHWRQTREALNFIIPAGNLGNTLACLMVRRMGLPVGDIRIACNANHVVSDFFAGKPYHPHASLKTFANAMDVGDPSNFERLRHLHDDDAALRAALSAASVDDERIGGVIRQAEERHGMLPCPHTACALYLLERLRADGDERSWAVVATAHAAKFDDVIRQFTGHTPYVPPALLACLERPRRADSIVAETAALEQYLRAVGNHEHREFQS